MSPEYIVGSIITEGGSRPFVMYTETGKFEVGTYTRPDAAQQTLSVIQQQRFIQLIAERAGLPFSQVRLGQYRCSECGEWVEATPKQWSISVCMSCSLDRASELYERYQEEEKAAAAAPPVADAEPTEAPVAPDVPDEEPAEEEEQAEAATPEPAPKDVAPEETAPEGVATEEEVLEEVLLDVEAPEDVAPEETMPEDAAPKERAREDVVLEEMPLDVAAPDVEAPEDEGADLDVPEGAFIDVVLLPDEAAMLEKAILLAVEAHSGQRDKAGDPYILHPLRMMLTLDTPSEKIAAVLHDVVEDTEWTLEGLRREGFSEEVIDAVACLTKQGDESYEAFVERAAQHPIARRVKLADVEDNMDVRRLDTLTNKDQDRLARYLRAWRRLKGV